MEKVERSVSPFQKLAFKYRHVVRDGLEYGLTARRLLDAQRNFRTTARHELVVATVCDTLGNWTGLDSAAQDRLNIAALVHDVDKRFEYKPEEFNSEQAEALKRFMASQDQDLMQVTKEQFIDTHKDDSAGLTHPQMLLYYGDMIVAWDQITPFRDRIAESRTRRPHLPSEFFDTEIKFGEEVQQRIFTMLPEEMKEKVADPVQIPNYLINFFQSKR